MKFIKLKRDIKKYVSICLCLGIILRPCMFVSAEINEFDTYYEIGLGNNTYDYDDLLSRYRINSVTYKKNILDYQI